MAGRLREGENIAHQLVDTLGRARIETPQMCIQFFGERAHGRTVSTARRPIKTRGGADEMRCPSGSGGSSGDRASDSIPGPAALRFAPNSGLFTGKGQTGEVIIEAIAE